MPRPLKPAYLAAPLLLALLLWGCAPGAAPSPTPTGAPAKVEEVPPPYKGMKNPFTLNDAAAIEAGKAIYTQSCLTCHGENGDGKGPAGAALKPPPADFTSAAQLEHFERVQDHHFWRLSEGVSGTAMPPFKPTGWSWPKNHGQLTEEQRWQVMTYEWSLGKK